MTAIKRCYLIPPDEQLCIWMSAGLLSYQLCNQRTDCESCPVDAVMHRRSPASRAVEKAEISCVAGSILQQMQEEGFRYSRNHWWAQKTAGGNVRLGIESGLAQTFLSVKGIVFPSPHQRLSKGQACIWVVMDGGTLALESPLDGVVHLVNHDLIAKPHLLSQEPFDAGWLCEIECAEANDEPAGLQDSVDIRARYSTDRTRFLASLSSAMRGRRPPGGATIADGGEHLQNFADILGPTRYIALMRQHFGWSSKS
jgi:glycine cleavage system H protein